jgi:release factor glutamine methyltransferase
MRIMAPPGVFEPRSDAWLLAAALREEGLAPGATVLDLCTGSGVVAVAAARLGLRVTAVDVSRRAVLAARVNARLNGVRVRARRGDLFAAVPGERFDAVVANPPYLPGGPEELPERGEQRAWEGGRDGRRLLDRILAGAPTALAPDGVLLVVHSSLCGERETLTRLNEAELEARVAARRRGPLGPLLRERAHELEARGILAPGEREEDLLVIRGYRPGSGVSVTGRPNRRSASPMTSSSL